MLIRVKQMLVDKSLYLYIIILLETTKLCPGNLFLHCPFIVCYCHRLHLERLCELIGWYLRQSFGCFCYFSDDWFKDLLYHCVPFQLSLIFVNLIFREQKFTDHQFFFMRQFFLHSFKISLYRILDIYFPAFGILKSKGARNIWR